MSDTTARGRAYRIEARRKKLEKALRTAAYMAYPRSIYVKYELVNGHVILGKYLQHRKTSKAMTYHKHRSAKAVRRAPNLPPRGNGYRKIYDYWWSID